MRQQRCLLFAILLLRLQFVLFSPLILPVTFTSCSKLPGLPVKEQSWQRKSFRSDIFFKLASVITFSGSINRSTSDSPPIFLLAEILFSPPSAFDSSPSGIASSCP